MKHLVAVLAVFLLMGSQTSAQETIPEPEILQDLPDFVMVNKPVVCGPIKQVLKKIKEFNEVRSCVDGIRIQNWYWILDKREYWNNYSGRTGG